MTINPHFSSAIFSKMLINNVKIGKISFSFQERVYDTFGK
ncbi:hypothetical protein ExPEC_0571 [Escherichia coli]|uniref:Uncharacterized protein n=1 Tax=Escherichia coli MS 85-1 TaxID=679202 RepID=A0AAN3MDM2_ECOLX|nr:hypothetical protein HMPREF9350_00591 [Escherichia coli MS 85-1]EGW91207.1 hypothetical protein ECSTECDG1313_2830 [Escherichia coli STEC_DG131-3]EHV97282.1 hypothetical protein ECDEC7B_2062 [Escherichia coli DEC7B]EHX78932.1 hypothetical protein ECDEC14A_2016 [Escherichia coli DEC14A]EHX98508.1 hypothetical protein ECDEC15A_2382 [Escherichia coli DEC15A]EHY05144.1 hypothetical protein ECDEC15B_2148 [Escherichia coli DEC15B]EHY07961.1 hypothetical protein ECDEC15C_2099 [Escherichia coli DEC